jgi:hypothetical protein
VTTPADSVDVNSGGIDDTLRLLLRDLAKESAKPTIRRARTGQRTVRRGGTVARMNTAVIPRILIALSIVYGAVVAIVAVSGSASVGIVATVGGIVVGACWALYAVLVPKSPKGS